MMLSDRMARIAPSPTLRVTAEADRLRRQGVDVVDLGAGEPDFPTPDHVKAAARAAIDANFTKYTPSPGIHELREAVCSRYRQDYGAEFRPEEVIVTAADKLRETLFNIVAARVPGARVLDVFAGSGAVGLEALSRGADRAVFIEQDRRAAALIADNAQLCGVRERCVIIRDAATRALRNPIDDDPFDLVMLDPPYDFADLDEVVGAAARHLAPDGLLILEHAARQSPPRGGVVQATRTVRSGDSALTLFEAR